ncbi:hypothetical protein CPB86DRAFT_212210 [Serendipita vermifera]|nr:hypothetical protein CPB86DRAFT_212210 [Serendipita vermifera]
MNTSSKRILPDPHPRHRPTRTEIRSSKSEINKLDRQISNLQAQIDEIQTQIDSLQHERDNHASYISPFRCLPVEILTKIFHYCLENDESRGELMEVCGTIRDIVTGTPAFWSKIRIWDPSTGNYDHWAFIALLLSISSSF